MNNYTMIDPSKGFEYDNLKLIRSFSGVPGEKGFHMTHVRVASRSPRIVTLINKIIKSVETDNRDTVNECLTSLEEVITENAAEMKEMFARNTSEDYN